MQLIAIITFLLFNHQPVRQPNATQVKRDTIAIDTTRYAILQFNKSRDTFIFDKNSKRANLSGEDLKKIEKIISVSVTEYNHQLDQGKKFRAKQKDTKPSIQFATGTAINKPGKYYKQLIPIINPKGEKEVWVNCFCTPHEKRYWRKGVVMILDGGPCFFNLKINLATNTVMTFSVNGVS